MLDVETRVLTAAGVGGGVAIASVDVVGAVTRDDLVVVVVAAAAGRAVDGPTIEAGWPLAMPRSGRPRFQEHNDGTGRVRRPFAASLRNQVVWRSIVLTVNADRRTIGKHSTTLNRAPGPTSLKALA
jgi:hypothetical protein